MDLSTANHNLNEVLQLENGCEYSTILDGALDNIGLFSSDVFNVLHLNIHSFHRNIDNLILLLKDLEERGIIIHAVGLCETFLSDVTKTIATVETFLSDVTKTIATVENYKVIHQCRKNRAGGGTSILLHDSV